MYAWTPQAGRAILSLGSGSRNNRLQMRENPPLRAVDGLVDWQVSLSDALLNVREEQQAESGFYQLVLLLAINGTSETPRVLGFLGLIGTTPRFQPSRGEGESFLVASSSRFRHANSQSLESLFPAADQRRVHTHKSPELSLCWGDRPGRPPEAGQSTEKGGGRLECSGLGSSTLSDREANRDHAAPGRKGRGYSRINVEPPFSSLPQTHTDTPFSRVAPRRWWCLPFRRRGIMSICFCRLKHL